MNGYQAVLTLPAVPPVEGSKESTIPRKKRLSWLPPAVGGALFALLYFGHGLSLIEAASFAVTVHLFLRFIDLIGKRIIILEIMTLSACVQWLVAPMVIARISFWSGLAVPDEVYYPYAFCGTLAMLIGVWLPIFRRSYRDHPALLRPIRESLAEKGDLGLVLFGIGFVCSLVTPYMPSALVVFVHLGANLMYLGAFYSYFSSSKKKYLVLGSIGFLLVATSLLTGLFWFLIFWTLFFIIVAAASFENTLAFRFEKIAIVIGGVAILVFLQSFKDQYRMSILKSNDRTIRANAAIMVDLAERNADIMKGKAYQDVIYPLVYRLNQSYINSKIMAHIPYEEPFVHGETVFLASAAAFIPRFLWPSKPGNDISIYNRLTGEQAEGVYFSVSPLGEAYANFGRVGGVITLFCYGLFFNLLLGYCLKIAGRHPTFLLWMPFIFFQVVRVETNFATTINYAVKSSVFVWLVFALARHNRIDL